MPRCQDWFLYYDIHREELLKVDLSKPSLPAISMVYKGDAQNFELLDNGRLLTITGLTRDNVISIMVFHQQKGSYIQIYEKHSKTFDKKSCIKYMKSQNCFLILWKDRIQKVAIELPKCAQICFPLCIMNPGNDAPENPLHNLGLRSNSPPEAYYMQLQRFQKEANLTQITSDGKWMIVYSFFTESLYFLEQGKPARTVDIPVTKSNADTIGSKWDRGKQPHRIVLDQEEKNLWILTVNLAGDNLGTTTDKELLEYNLLSLDLQTFQFSDHSQRIKEKAAVVALLPNKLVLRHKSGGLVSYHLKSGTETEIPHDLRNRFLKCSQNYLLVSVLVESIILNHVMSLSEIVSDTSLTGDKDAAKTGAKAADGTQSGLLQWLDLDGDLRSLTDFRTVAAEAQLQPHDQTDKPQQSLVAVDKKIKDTICSAVVAPDRTEQHIFRKMVAKLCI